MKVTEILTEGMNKRDTFEILHDFVRFAAKDLELKNLPKFDFVFDSNESIERKSFGGYQPGAEHITITVKNRHIMDVCRTLAHELVHYKQDLDNELDDDEAGATGSPQENDANARAAVIMRNWGKAHPSYFGQESVA
jgi:hypothetical protein